MKKNILLQTRFRRLKAYLFPVQSNILPEKLQKNFRHLYFDIAWFGLLNGSAISFLTIFAARLGASGSQIGLINATPAVISLTLALPIGSWLENRKLDRSVFLSTIFHRFFYFLFALLPLLLISDETQIWIITVLTLVMSIPGAVIAVGFNVLFAAAVPANYRGMVAGRRNAVFAVVTVLTSLISGRILTTMPFPTGYQIIFLMGAIGGVMSAIHIWFVKPYVLQPKPVSAARTSKGFTFKQPIRRFLIYFSSHYHPEALKGKFGKVLLLLTLYHFFHYLSIPLFPIFTVNNLNLNDQVISLGNAFFYVTMFIGSTQLAKLTSRYGNHKITAIGMIALGLYPTTLSLATGPTMFMVSMILAGFAWALGGTAMVNYLLDAVPSEKSAGYMAWFTVGVNAAILLGNSIGPLIAAWLGLPVALFIFGLLRSAAGLIVLKRG
ncbi:MAG: hypothetical protein CL609_24580 [Anaerolineaceae bacterium]|nr:hypothetical protein [Anaerolineaceae bacterium]